MTAFEITLILKLFVKENWAYFESILNTATGYTKDVYKNETATQPCF